MTQVTENKGSQHTLPGTELEGRIHTAMTGNEIRATFLRFFEERGHRVVRSSSLVPTNDPTLLFTNAGMNQFKDVFLGLEQRDYNRATSCQKCVRAGGKHNDLENVGFTNRHHTFFEMLGNFSFGDYFKKDAIAYAWELITSGKWFALPLDKLYFTVFGGAEIAGKKLDPDHEAAKLWLNVGAPKDRVLEVPGLKENFWVMGDTGPCGPCSEIFYDMGPAASDQGHTDCKFGCDCGRYVEIWNLVFMQFNRDSSGHLNPLPKPSVDTGAGLERLAAVLQGKISNFDTDLFKPLMQEAARLTNADVHDAKIQPSLRIIADHTRASTFLIADGVVPSNEGRGYVLRKIIRRALRHAHTLNAPSPFLSVISGTARTEMKQAYPELEDGATRVTRILDEEERRFTHTVEVGLKKLDLSLKVVPGTSYVDELVGLHKIAMPDPDSERYNLENILLTSDQQQRLFAASIVVGDQYAPELVRRLTGPVAASVSLRGSEAFRVYDTYGLQRDFIEDVTRDAGLKVDWVGFDRAMEEQRTRARASWKGTHKEVANPAYARLAETFKTEPDFYFGTDTRDCRIEAIITKEGSVNEIKKGTEAEIVLDRTSIYSESGGQVADTGGFYDDSETLEVAEVKGAYYPVTGLIAHRIVAKEGLHVGDRVATVADPERRARNMRNHTATHLMNAALRNILGTHVKQAGSLVAPDHLRFDFSHFAAVDPSELADIEQQVNEEIRKNLDVTTDIMNIDDALASGALAFFGDKYPEANVRVVTMPDASSPRGFYSKELCGGTHVARTGAIGVFKILGEQSTAAGVRRIEAISGDRALAEYQRALATLHTAAGLLNASEDQIIQVLERQIDQARSLEKQLEALKRKAAGSQAQDLLDRAREVKGVRVLAVQVDGVDRESLRNLSDSLRQKIGSGVIILGAIEDGKVALITAVTKDLTPRLHAGKIVQELAKLVGGSGGGRPDLAEAGGKDTSGIEKAIDQVYPLLDRLL
ncbi:MAG TPA: alanine--tRNA ligase [Candidatus Acidoferrales bacterium]|nr:alanine--tRNA ligase [Candidatus Acidoferrales bacterium]